MFERLKAFGFLLGFIYVAYLIHTSRISKSENIITHHSYRPVNFLSFRVLVAEALQILFKFDPV